MLILLTFKPALGVRSPSPFTLKADGLLAMSGLPYERKFGDVRKAPKGKYPVLVDGDRIIPDSSHIQHYLEREKGIDFDAGLNEAQRATALAVRRMLENHLYFISTYFRWIENPDITREALFADIPGLLRKPVFAMLQGRVRKTLHLHGIGRHSPDQMLEFGKEDMAAVAALLGEKDWFFGDDPKAIDACIFGFLEGILNATLDTPLQRAGRGHANLVAFCDRFRKRYFGGKAE
jgi:glutathione S-transferase